MYGIMLPIVGGLVVILVGRWLLGVVLHLKLPYSKDVISNDVSYACIDKVPLVVPYEYLLMCVVPMWLTDICWIG